MRIQHNIMAMNAYRNYSANSSALSKNLEKLSSGYKINRAGDDAAGLAISEKMRAQITGLKTAQSNAKDGVSLVQTAEGAMTEVHDMLNRMAELADQSANGTYDSGTDRTNLQKEVTQLKSEIDRIADSSNFNGIKLLNGDRAAYTVSSNTSTGELSGVFLSGGKATTGTIEVTLGTSGDITIDAAGLSGEATNVTFSVSENVDGEEGGVFTVKASYTGTDEATKDAWEGVTLSFVVGKATSTTTPGEYVGNAITLAISAPATGKGELTLQIGDTSANYNQLGVSIADMHTDALGIDKIDISTQSGAESAVDQIRNAINLVSSTRGNLGATQNRLEHTMNNLSVMSENITDAESSIRDTDVAEEMMSYTKNNILVQSAQAMLAQANQIPQGVLQLLQ